MTPDDETLAAALMARAHSGDPRAYDELLRLLAQYARRFVMRRVGGAEWVEDVVQEVLLTVHRSRHSYDPVRPFGPWFYTIAQCRLIDALRSRRRLAGREVIDDEALANVAAAATSGVPSAVGEALASAVARLPRVQREVVSLLKYDDLSVREVACRLGMSEAAVKTTAHRGYKVLRRMVGGVVG
jgi:RNA polymerase sigma-70 factor, ECF subfamily